MCGSHATLPLQYRPTSWLACNKKGQLVLLVTPVESLGTRLQK